MLDKREEAAEAGLRVEEARKRASVHGTRYWVEGVNYFGAPDGASEAWTTLEERFWSLKEEIKALSLTKELDELGGRGLEELRNELEVSSFRKMWEFYNQISLVKI
jgi:hypothetical protein